MVRSVIVGALLAACALLPAAARPAKPLDRPEVVQACPWFGPGFFRVPGNDACIRLSGEVLAESRFDFARRDLYIETVRILGNPLAFYDRPKISHRIDRTQLRSDARLTLMSATDVGGFPLVTSLTLRNQPDTTAATRGAGATAGDILHADQAWLRYRWVTAGKHPSYFDFSTGYTLTGGYGSQRNVNLLALTFRPSNATSLTLSLEDGASRRYEDGVWASYGAQRRPDVVVQGRWAPSFATLHASAALHPIRDGLAGRSKEGYALSAGLEYRQKWSDLFGTAAGDTYGRFLLTAATTRGALDYLGLPRFATDYAADLGGRLVQSRATAFIASYEHVWRPDLKTVIGVSGYDVHMPLTNYDHRVRGTVAQIGIEYMPVSNLMVGAEANLYRDSVRGAYFGVRAPTDRVEIVTGSVYLRRRF